MLGKILFWDEQLSSDNTMACGTCHQPRQGGADPRFTQTPGPDGIFDTGDDIYASPGVISADSTGHYLPSSAFGLDHQVTGRLAPSFITGAYFTLNFWDGRASSAFTDPQTGRKLIVSGGALESQLVNPPFSSIEMADPGRSWTDLVNKLTAVRPLALATGLPQEMALRIAEHPSYPDLFTWVFGDSSITSARIAFAIATYERTLVPDHTPWDDFQRGYTGALDQRHQDGLNLFMGQGRCNLCHIPPLFADDKFHALGVRPPHEDMGLQKTTGVWSDRGRFKTPSLRDAGRRGRFMHDGRFGDLNQVLEFYVRGGDYPDNKDFLIVPLSITPTDKAKIIDFLNDSLTDPRVAAETAPFDRPTLHSEAAANPEYYGAASAGSGGFIPRMINVTPPLLGTQSFRIGVGDALGGAAAILALAPAAAPPGTFFNGIPIDIAINPVPKLISLTLSGSGAGGGFGTIVLQLPSNPALAGQDWYAQWFVVDPAARSGVAASGGSHYRLFGR
jgi:cytochrome c peroxidase